MRRTSFVSFIFALSVVEPAMAEVPDCAVGNVTFETAGTETTLSFRIHEGKFEVAKGLHGLTELEPMGGVFAVYDAPRGDRPLANSIVMAADIVSFGTDGRLLNLMVDETGDELDYMNSGDGMLYAAYLAAGTINAAGFDGSTVMKGWECTEEG